MKQVYRFRVGVSNLGSSSSLGSSLSSSFGFFLGSSRGLTHACFLIDRDLFDYGANKDKSYRRLYDVGRDSSYNWISVGNALNGRTYVSPDDLEEAIIDSDLWGPKTYNPFTHNCHDFVEFCLREVGCPESMIRRNWFTYREQIG